VANGGEITCDHVAQSLARRRPVLVLAGTGRTTDASAAAVAGHGDEPRAAQIAASPLIRIRAVTVDAPTDAIGEPSHHKAETVRPRLNNNAAVRKIARLETNILPNMTG
jgi:hypothetical protein